MHKNTLEDLDFFHPKSRIWIFPSQISETDPQPWIDKEFKYCQPKKLLVSSPTFDPRCSSRIQFSDPAGKKALDPGSGSATPHITGMRNGSGMFMTWILGRPSTKLPFQARVAVSRYILSRICRSLSIRLQHVKNPHVYCTATHLGRDKGKKSVLRIRDVYPGSWFLPIPDLGSKNSNKREGWKKICSHKFHKIENYFSFEVLEKNLGKFSKNYRTFYPKNVTKLLKIRVRDPGSEIRDPEKTYSGSRIQGSKRHRIPDPDPQHWKKPIKKQCFGSVFIW